ncbi:MAG: phage tail assembly protein [Gallionella sp.]|nr:phage tail assembly protein [Gallionella sp.]MDD4947445.1 phage tail assembly protein [Gallionella sp.]
MKLALKHPLAVGKTTIEELTFRDYATAEDLLAFDERGANQQTIKLIANLTGSDEAIIRRLHVADYRAADKIASDLIKSEADEKNASES